MMIIRIRQMYSNNDDENQKQQYSNTIIKGQLITPRAHI